MYVGTVGLWEDGSGLSGDNEMRTTPDIVLIQIPSLLPFPVLTGFEGLLYANLSPFKSHLHPSTF